MAEIKKTKLLDFARTLNPGQGVTIYQDSPFAGYIKHVVAHWPGGCTALVDIGVGHSNTQFCPRGIGNFLHLDNATPSYPDPTSSFNEKVEQGEEIWVEMRNRDGGFPHSITVTVSVEEE